MDKTFLQLIELVRKVIKNEAGDLDKELFPDIGDIDMWKKVYRLAMQQEVQTFLYEATKELELPENVKKNFYSVYNRAVRKEAIMHLEVSRCMEEFDKAGVVYAPIKGWKLKNLYEKPYLRTMTDVDIMVREDGFKKACDIMTACEFNLDSDSGNHYVFSKKPVTEVELHHRLFSETSIMYKWGRDVFAKNDSFSLSDEDSYIYMIAHMAKHITKEGAGMRNIVDCYLYNKKYRFDDKQREYIECSLKEVGLDIFEKQVDKISRVWFDGVAYDAESEMIATYIMDGGLYGKVGNGATLRLNNINNNKFKWIIREIFPNFESLKLSFNFKRMYKALTPVYWVMRIIRALFNRDRIKTRAIVMTKDKEEIEKSERIIVALGLTTIDY